MSQIQHHIPEHVLAAYASGNLPFEFSLVVAAHVSMCLECRASLEAHQAIGGQLLESIPDMGISDGLKSDVMALLDAPEKAAPVYSRSGIYPGPIMEALKGAQPKWKALGGGVRQSILSHEPTGSVRLLHIPPGMAVPDHGHNGLELTLVLQGSFSDEAGSFGPGDVEVADDDVEHTPIAGDGLPCICLAATDAPLRFRSFLPRMLQPLFRI
ncbi:ChrR family anti-sigma-E factor [Aliiruegeria haliotis]|nr:ChrR family anti-sigma-E factor [Aliiruegeria haliotis]